MRVIVGNVGDLMPVTGDEFRWMLPGERAVAVWGAGRAQKVQGDSRELVSGAYIIVAALWGLLGATVMLVGALVDVVGSGGPSSTTAFIIGAILLTVSFFRQTQSRRARKRRRIE
jgi:hypothetical protein